MKDLDSSQEKTIHAEEESYFAEELNKAAELLDKLSQNKQEVIDAKNAEARQKAKERMQNVNEEIAVKLGKLSREFGNFVSILERQLMNAKEKGETTIVNAIEVKLKNLKNQDNIFNLLSAESKIAETEVKKVKLDKEIKALKEEPPKDMSRKGIKAEGKIKDQEIRQNEAANEAAKAESMLANINMRIPKANTAAELKKLLEEKAKAESQFINASKKMKESAEKLEKLKHLSH